MIRYLARRLALMVPVGLGVVTLTFIIMQLTPGDPAIAYLGDKATPEAVAALRAEWGLDEPLITQYFSFLGGLVTGDLGNSLYFKVPISQLLAIRMPPTLILMVMASVLAVVISVPLSVWAATSRSAVAAVVIRFFTATVQGIPTFFLGTLMITFLAVRLQWFPVGGYGDTFGEHLHSLVLPALAIALNMVPLLVRSLTNSIGEALESEFVDFGRSKGLKETSVLLHYAMRNGSISGISILGIQIGNLAGGALVVENVFAIPGMGSMLMNGVLNRDFPTVQVCTVVFAGLVVAIYLLTDIAYGWLDPRARVQR
ncbi:MAG: ABC transporter permease [Propionibacteriaceae bacterium]